MVSFQAVFSSVLLAVQIFTVIGGAAKSISENTCAAYSSSSRVVNVNINSKRDEEGEWLTTFNAVKSDGSTDHFVVDVTQTVHDCAGGQAVQITGVIHGNKRNASAFDSLMFHRRCGTNAGLSDDRKSVKKINDLVPLNGVTLTHRPLRRNELFEVRLDKKLTSYAYSFGIGVTSYTPENINLPDHMWNLKSGNWMYYHTTTYKDGVNTKSNYGRDLNKLEKGSKVGVLVNNAGTLHYFVDGTDQGPAASNIPDIVYGVFELYYNAAEATIVDL